MRFLQTCALTALVAGLAMSQAGCVLSGKPKTTPAAAVPPAPKPEAAPKTAPPPEPLSVPQTQVQLPPEQPINPDALAPAKPEEPAPTPAAPRPARRAPATPKPEIPAAVATAPAATPKPDEAATVQEVLTPEDRTRLEQSAHAKKAEIRQILVKMHGRRLTSDQNREVKRIQSLVSQSDQVEKRGDMRKSDHRCRTLGMCVEVSPRLERV